MYASVALYFLIIILLHNDLLNSEWQPNIINHEQFLKFYDDRSWDSSHHFFYELCEIIYLYNYVNTIWQRVEFLDLLSILSLHLHINIKHKNNMPYIHVFPYCNPILSSIDHRLRLLFYFKKLNLITYNHHYENMHKLTIILVLHVNR